MNLSSYLEQHKSIAEEIAFIKNNLNAKSVESNADEIALHINQLSGKIKIHLMNEDKFLYPSLGNHQDEGVRKMAADYQTEMGGLQETFKIFKDKYNTKTKILENKELFIKEGTEVIKAIEQRISKEEDGIYLHIS
ncbi:hemerythrin domain-containing protein [Konateibacter massiliensis]|uniref:hemerythrin domain-containing protein n=1 Tax=Konateibacter massiliensis TaxID=2002841 RepID=UPI000C151B51|nr:hemerythrin domain-containing protein [Konateibacter massiliensis]